MQDEWALSEDIQRFVWKFRCVAQVNCRVVGVIRTTNLHHDHVPNLNLIQRNFVESASKEVLFVQRRAIFDFPPAIFTAEVWESKSGHTVVVVSTGLPAVMQAVNKLSANQWDATLRYNLSKIALGPR
ncbi:hypothetical protein D3C75_1147470 [compost metagenome]